jgi:putative peptidoglycan lipid II flippase
VPSESAGDAERHRIATRAGIVAAGTITSRLLGLVREGVVAAIFTRPATDAFFVAFTIPNVLRQLLAEGAMQTAVLPVLTETREKQGPAAARRLFRSLRGLSLLALIATALFGVVFAAPLVELFAAGFHDQQGQFERTVELTRWLFPYILFMGTAALGAAALNSERRFVVSSLAPALLNVGLIAAAFALPAWLLARGSDPVLALAFGALVGGVLQVVAQWPSLRRIGYLERPAFELGQPGVREVLRRLAPGLAGIGIYLVDVMLTRRFLSELGVGAQSYFSWAQRLCDVPQAVFALALQTATLPSLALLHARGEKEELSRTFAFGMRLSLFVGIAASALFVSLAEPLVVLIFQRGQFDAGASHETARALVAQGLGVWTVACIRQLVALYYVLGDTRTPVVVTALDLGVFVVIALSLRGSLGHEGISWAVTGASTAQLALLWFGLGRRIEDRRVSEIARSIGKTLCAALPATAAAAWTAHRISVEVGSGPFARMLPGLCGLACFSIGFLVLARMLKSEELTTLLDVIRRRAAG